MSYASAAAAAALRRFWLWRNRGRFSQLPPRHTPRLLVDVSAILQHDARTGIQRVVRAIFSELMRRSGADFLVVPIYATRRAGYRYAPRDFLTASRTSLGSEPVQAGPNDTFLGLDLAAHVLPAYQAQLRAWRANGATIHLVVYDLLPLMNPGWFTKRALWHFRRWFDFLAADADQAICISGAVASEVTRELARRNSAMPIGRLTLGGDIMSSVPSMGIDAEVEFVLERIRFRPAILMVGTVEPRKGHEVALRAFEYLWRDRADDAPDLVIVGKPGWKTEALQARILSHPELGKRLHWLTAVSDEALCKLYEKSRGVFNPSRAEGFGLPLIEAATARRHVLARDLAAFREQQLPNVLFFEDEDPATLAGRLIELSRLGEAPAPPNLTTWKNCVDGLLGEIGISEPAQPRTERPLRKAS